jgi:hypothetical protein
LLILGSLTFFFTNSHFSLDSTRAIRAISRLRIGQLLIDSKVTKMLPVPLSHLRSVVDNDGAVILDAPRNRMTTLNPTGAYIWQRLERGMPVHSIVTELARETSMDEAVVQIDVDAFIKELKAKELITIS